VTSDGDTADVIVTSGAVLGGVGGVGGVGGGSVLTSVAPAAGWATGCVNAEGVIIVPVVDAAVVVWAGSLMSTTVTS
jgi:hypothetical protein